MTDTETQTKTIRVRRSYLIRTVEEFDLDVPVDLDVDAWQDADPIAFDEHVLDFGRQVSDYCDLVDNDELETVIVEVRND